MATFCSRSIQMVILGLRCGNVQSLTVGAIFISLRSMEKAGNHISFIKMDLNAEILGLYNANKKVNS